MTAGQGLSKYKVDQRSDKVLLKGMHKVLQGAQGALQGDTQRVLLTNTRQPELSSGGSVDQNLLDLQHTRLQVLPGHLHLSTRNFVEAQLKKDNHKGTLLRAGRKKTNTKELTFDPDA